MHLTRHTDYALRLLMLLAIEPDAPHTIEEVASRYAISQHHLTKVAQTLARAGFIATTRGRGGGIELGRPATSINVGAVVRATEDSFAIVECFDRSRNACAITPACALRGILKDATQAFLATLDGFTLADLRGERPMQRRMSRLLATPAEARA